MAYAQEGVEKAIEFGADFLLAVGGGSSIDTAKAIAHGVANPDWSLEEIWGGEIILTRSTPVGCVLTIAAAGSETSDSAVLTNEEIREKGRNQHRPEPPEVCGHESGSYIYAFQNIRLHVES